jgi:hypothetical protein
MVIPLMSVESLLTVIAVLWICKWNCENLLVPTYQDL